MKNFNPIFSTSLALLLTLPSLAAAAADPFGVTQLYPTTSGGKEWTSNWGNGLARTFTWGADPKDSWFFGKGNASYTVDGKGNFIISGAVPRLYIYNPTQATQWRNVEMTVYAMRVADSGTAYGGIVGAARTNHTADTTNLCDTRGIMGRFRYDGHIDLEKETSHPNSVAIQNKTVFSGGLPKNKWIGYKLVVRDLPNGNVKVENYMDQTDGAGGGTWVKVNEIEDTGKNFGVGGKACKSGIDPAMRLTASATRAGSETGKPNLAVYWRSDNVGTNGLIYKKMTVREITAEAAPPPPPASVACITSVGSWANAALPAQSGLFTASFEATPGIAKLDGVAGLSNGAASGYAALAAAVRFNNSGRIDARNGSAFKAATAIPYSPNLAYRFRLVVNLPARTYSAYVKQGTGNEQVIGTDYAFRSEQSAVGKLDNVGLLASNGGETVCNAVATAAGPAPDTTAPVISGVSPTGVGENSATIVWTTDEAADTQVEFGLSTSYGSWSAHNSTLKTAHSAALSGLSAGTLYHYRAKSRDAAANMAISADGTFTTAAPPPPPPPPGGACIASSGLWANAAMTAQTGQFTAEFDATPSIAMMDGVAGLSDGPASAYSALAASVRFNNTGTIDARDGSGFKAATPIAYSPGLTYRFRLVVNPTAHTYSAYVKQGTGDERLIGADYAFRTEQYALSRLSNLGLIASSGSEQVCGLAVTAGGQDPAPTAAFSDSFTAYPTSVCLADGAKFGAWTSVFGGYGCTQVKTDGTRSWLDQAPFPAASAAATHASLVTGPAFSTPYTLTLDMNTFAQLRQNDPPNAWETAWVVWHYTDDEHFYYFTLKPNGWELGKRDPAYPGGQRFLATGPTPTLAVGAWNKVAVAVSGGSMQVSVDGQPVTSFTDGERPYSAGAIGLYNEDANVRFTDVKVVLGGTTLAAAAAAPAAAPAAATDLAKAPQKFLSPALADGINDTAIFGREAAEVSIFNVLGREVFRASQQGSNPIVWDCKDGSGRVRESGVYIARIRKTDSDVFYQSFALVK